MDEAYVLHFVLMQDREYERTQSGKWAQDGQAVGPADDVVLGRNGVIAVIDVIAVQVQPGVLQPVEACEWTDVLHPVLAQVKDLEAAESFQATDVSQIVVVQAQHPDPVQAAQRGHVSDCVVVEVDLFERAHAGQPADVAYVVAFEFEPYQVRQVLQPFEAFDTVQVVVTAAVQDYRIARLLPIGVYAARQVTLHIGTTDRSAAAQAVYVADRCSQYRVREGDQLVRSLITIAHPAEDRTLAGPQPCRTAVTPHIRPLQFQVERAGRPRHFPAQAALVRRLDAVSRS